MIRKATWTLALLAMLIWECPPAQAEYQGELRRDLDLVLNVDNSSAASRTAVTVHYLSSGRDENEISRDEIEIRLVPAGGRVQFVFSKPGRGVRRIIVDVDAPKSTTIDVDFAGFPERIEGHGHLVFDVVD